MTLRNRVEYNKAQEEIKKRVKEPALLYDAEITMKELKNEIDKLTSQHSQ